MTKKLIIIISSVTILGGLLAWLFVESSKPPPGEKITDLGREHIEIGKEVKYNSNPPTSGSHYVEWIKAGVYETPKDDRNLVHSLEHGYVIMHYKCQGASMEASQSASIASSSAQLDSSCREKKGQLEEVFNSKEQRKLIVVPRSDLDTNFALTAWTYIDKLDDFDRARIEKFIDAHLNQGPEKTME